MYFSKGVDDSLCDQLSLFFGFQQVPNLERYLEVPLLHGRVTKSTLNFVVEKVRWKVQTWEARKLSFAGRVTLAQLVLITIPNYFMQPLFVSKGSRGGLGFWYLHDQNNSFLMKIGFNLISRKYALWAPTRGIGQSSAYPLCGHGTENILHVIRDYSTAKEAWMLVVSAEKLNRSICKDQSLLEVTLQLFEVPPDLVVIAIQQDKVFRIS
ncbi:hypothetical protein J1N35_003290 [Gossypium stocksii]|uniref:Uncharacterized protein n=1 Tax=Gossypium stocksii TaxID=47602 RepID=A0A9D4ANM7_9ROSI|nr:hypothetical protein J1N35_003290 [Gossypium stocksii]